MLIEIRTFKLDSQSSEDNQDFHSINFNFQKATFSMYESFDFNFEPSQK